MKKIIICLIAIITFFSSILMVKAEDDINITKNAASAILVDYDTGKVLYNKNANDKKAVASLTKMMGLIIIFETLENNGIALDEMITISKNAKEMGGSQVWLEEGEVISINDLIKSIVMASANDAMVAMAERISGTEEAFVKLMNEKAYGMGLKNTNFVNSTGLDEDGNYSSSYDMSIIARELISHEEILSFTSVYESYIRENTDNKTWLSNTNKLVRFYAGADGLKTGLTDEAGSCMAVTAKRDGLRLIAITLGYSESKLRNSETMSLLDYGFNQYKARILYKKGDIVGARELDKANNQEIKFVAANDITILQKKTDKEIDYKYEIESNFKLPVKTGDNIGTLYLKENGVVINKYKLLSNNDIKKVSFIKLFFRNLCNI